MAGGIYRRVAIADGDGKTLQRFEVVSESIADGSLSALDGYSLLAAEGEVTGRLWQDVDTDVFCWFSLHDISHEDRLYLHWLLAILV